jgi:hypothetical protein
MSACTFRAQKKSEITREENGKTTEKKEVRASISRQDRNAPPQSLVEERKGKGWKNSTAPNERTSKSPIGPPSNIEREARRRGLSRSKMGPIV